MIIGHQEDLTSSPDPNLSIQLSRALIDRDQAVARKIADSFFPAIWKQQTPRKARKLTTILLCEVYVALLDFGDDIPDTQLSPYLKKLENAADPSECSRIFFSCIQGLLNAKTKPPWKPTLISARQFPISSSTTGRRFPSLRSRTSLA